MKTKAYKLRENIARYIYEYIGKDDVSICLNNDYEDDTGIWNKWEMHVGGKIVEQYKLSYFEKKRIELENILGFGIDLCVYEGTAGTTLLWNKDKESEYEKTIHSNN